jgi:hypothetical protein
MKKPDFLFDELDVVKLLSKIWKNIFFIIIFSFFLAFVSFLIFKSTSQYANIKASLGIPKHNFLKKYDFVYNDKFVFLEAINYDAESKDKIEFDFNYGSGSGSKKSIREIFTKKYQTNLSSKKYLLSSIKTLDKDFVNTIDEKIKKDLDGYYQKIEIDVILHETAYKDSFIISMNYPIGLNIKNIYKNFISSVKQKTFDELQNDIVKDIGVKINEIENAISIAKRIDLQKPQEIFFQNDNIINLYQYGYIVLEENKKFLIKLISEIEDEKTEFDEILYFHSFNENGKLISYLILSFLLGLSISTIIVLMSKKNINKYFF